MGITWKLSELRARVRIHAAIPDTADMTDDEIDNRINDFYRNRFPLVINDQKLNDWYKLTLQATDSGDYDLSDDILKIYGDEKDNPVLIDDNQIRLYQNSAQFFAKFPLIDTGAAYWITTPSLAMGLNPYKKVANSAFTFRTNDSDYTYSKAAAETALSGDTVPQNKYGCWRLEINGETGIISIVEADDNATGYLTAAQAMQGLPEESDENACMGFVTAINTSDSFIPGTTALNAAGVIATFTDGFVSTRSIPEAALLEDGILYIRPKMDDTYLFTAYTKIKPTALSSDDSVPLSVDWGPMLACGTAIEIAVDNNNDELRDQLSVLYEKFKSLIERRFASQFFSGTQRAIPSF